MKHLAKMLVIYAATRLQDCAQHPLCMPFAQYCRDWLHDALDYISETCHTAYVAVQLETVRVEGTHAIGRAAMYVKYGVDSIESTDFITALCGKKTCEIHSRVYVQDRQSRPPISRSDLQVG